MDRASQVTLGLHTLAAVWRVLFAFAVTYVFTIILLTAAAQQQVTAALAANPSKLDYSSAYARMREIERIQKDVIELAKLEQNRVQQLQEANYQLRELTSAADEAWNGFSPVADQMRLAGDCIRMESQDHLAIWGWFTQCLRATDIEPRRRRGLEDLVSKSPNAADLYRLQLAQERRTQRAEAALATAQRELETARASAVEGGSLRRDFASMNVLRNSPWLVGGATFINFPPLLLQVLQALSAGAFGALLLTLVLTVYPTNGLKLHVGQGFELRVLLGGLIAVCVYVVLSGGTSILGASGDEEGATNVMTFCAVGILAGMFSDRVASWLSEKADIFFASEQHAPKAPAARPQLAPIP